MKKNKRTVRFSTVASAFTGRTVLEDESTVLKDYFVGQRIGEGAYGSVYVAKYIPSGEIFALKILQKDTLFQGYSLISPVDKSVLSEECKLATEGLSDTSPMAYTNKDSQASDTAKGIDLSYRKDIMTQSFYPRFPTRTQKAGGSLSYQQSFINRMEKLIIQEATVSQSLEHPHVVKVYKFLNSTVSFYFLMELAEGGELFDLILSKHYFSEPEARHYFQQLISAIDYCHSCGVAHKDLKAENLLLDRYNRLLVCDFGFSSRAVKRNVDDPEGSSTIEPTESGIGSEFFQGSDGSIVGTMHYMSPEAVLASTLDDTTIQPNFWGEGGDAIAGPPENQGFFSSDSVGEGVSKTDIPLALARYTATGASSKPPKSPSIQLAGNQSSHRILSTSHSKIFYMSRYSTAGKNASSNNTRGSLRSQVKRHISVLSAEATHADATSLRSPLRNLSLKLSKEKSEQNTSIKQNKSNESSPSKRDLLVKKNMETTKGTVGAEPSSLKSESIAPPSARRANPYKGDSKHLASNQSGSAHAMRNHSKSHNLRYSLDKPPSTHYMSRAKKIMMNLFSFSNSAQSSHLKKGTASALHNPDASISKLTRSRLSSSNSIRTRRIPHRRWVTVSGRSTTQSLRKLSNQRKESLGGNLSDRLTFTESAPDAVGSAGREADQSCSLSHLQDEPETAVSVNRHKVVVDPFQQDLWSAGVLLFFMLTGRLPFDGRDEEETLYLIQNIKYTWTEEEAARISPEARQLVQEMLSLDPIDRPSLDSIIFNKWFAKDINLEADFPHRKEELLVEMTERKLLVPASPMSYTGSASSFPLVSISRPLSFLDFSSSTHVVTPEEEQVIDTAFRKIDADGYGKITRDQIRDMLTYLHGDVVGPDKVSELVNLFTGDPQSKEITFEQFRDAWVNKDLTHAPFTHSSEFQLANIIGTQMDEVERQVVRQLRVAFDSVDKDHLGVIDLKELKEVFNCARINVDEEDVVSLMHFFLDQELVVKGSNFNNNGGAYLLPSKYTNAVGGNGVNCVGSPRSVPRSPRSYQNLYITFENFVMGITQRNILLRHPLGRRLAAATNLTALFHSRNVTECVRHGFLVVGLQNVVLEKLASIPDRLLLLYSDEIVSTTENIYSFRYLGSSALIHGLTLSAEASKLSVAPQSIPELQPMSAAAAATLNLQPQLSQRWTVPTNAGSLPNNPAPSISDFLARTDVSSSMNRGKPNAKAQRSTQPRHGLTLQPTANFRRAPNPGPQSKLQTEDTASPCGSLKGPFTGKTSVRPQQRLTPAAAKNSSPNRPRRVDPFLNAEGATRSETVSPFSPPNIKISNSASPRSTVVSPIIARNPSYTQTTAATRAHKHTISFSSPNQSQQSNSERKKNGSVPQLPRTRISGTGKANPSPSGKDKHQASCSPHRAEKSISQKPVVKISKIAFDVESKSDGNGCSGMLDDELVMPVLGEGTAHTSSSAPAAVPVIGWQENQCNSNSNRETSFEAGMDELNDLEGSHSLQQSMCMVNMQTGNPINHRALSYGANVALQQSNDVCDLDIILAPACMGYTLVRIRRIHGKTSVFHEAVDFISNLLEVERQKAVEDTMPSGESELM